MQATVARLESEVSELQQSRTALHQDNTQQLESLERLRRENTELQQRVSVTVFLYVDVFQHVRYFTTLDLGCIR